MICSRCFRVLKHYTRISPNPFLLSPVDYSTTPSTQIAKHNDEENYSEFVLGLNNKQRMQLKMALNEFSNTDMMKEQQEEDTVPVSNQQLKLVLLQSGLPFIGFGFLDNVIMIIAGEYIDMTIGVSLGISTMAAAAIGNLISDLFGLGLADTVESLCRKLGLPNPNLSISQIHLSSVRWAQRLGRVLGVAVGCIIGMAPLLWFDNDDSNHHDNSKQQEK